MAAIAREGVSLRNSHALFPIFTTANAATMATGHMLGDTGDFSNTICAGFGSSRGRQQSDPVFGE
jgi:Type I phosphodiesterase / nucleotide pyrophosphatase